MKKRIVQEISGFHPLFESVVEKYGLTIAAVYGVAWRYCQMEDGVCWASQHTIAKKLGLGVGTVNRSIKVLCRDGYLIDTTPNAKPRETHVYKDGGLVVMKSQISAEAKKKSVPEGNSDTVPLWNSPVPSWNTTVPHAHSIKESNKESNIEREEEEENSETDSIFKMYAENIGRLSPIMKRTLKSAIKAYSAKWVYDAIHKAATYEGKSWEYVAAILRQWKRDGFQEKDAKHRARDLATDGPRQSPPPAPEPDWMAEVRKRSEARYAKRAAESAY